MTDAHEITEDFVFYEKDPFNPGNYVEATLTRDGGKFYGSMEFRKVNGDVVYMPRIFGTPKLVYPFDINGNYHFPSASQIYSFRKFDGTNVFMYPYYDTHGNRYITFKVRLFPFMRRQFLPMWRSILKRYPDITKLFLRNPGIGGFSFELYGSHNTHLIQYDQPLDIALLFAIKGEGEVVLNTDIDAPGIPKAERQAQIFGDYVWNYENDQKQLSERLKIVSDPGSEELMFQGDEGSVWYMKEKASGKWRMFKCKPHEIEKIHWEHVSIPHAVVQATAMNALETDDRITVEAVSELLKEDFTEDKIGGSIQRILKAVNFINSQAEARDKVRELIEPFKDEQDIPTIMRALSKHFPKSGMKLAYNYVIQIRQMEA